MTGTTGTLFLYGIVVGAAGLLGLSLLLAGVRRTYRRGSEARRGLRTRTETAESRRETAAASHDRDDLLDQRETARAYTVHDEQQNYTASTPGDGPAGSGRDPVGDGGGQLRTWHPLGSRSASAQAAAPSVQAVNEHVPDVPAGDGRTGAPVAPD